MAQFGVSKLCQSADRITPLSWTEFEVWKVRNLIAVVILDFKDMVCWGRRPPYSDVLWPEPEIGPWVPKKSSFFVEVVPSVVEK